MHDETAEVTGFEKPAVVIDNGSHLIKAGFSCDNYPVSIFRTIVGRPKNLKGRYGRAGHYEVFIGDDAVERTDYDWNPPVVNGRIVHWDNMERVWHHVFYRELKAAPEDRAVMVACSPLLPMAEKIRACQVFFEALNIPALCIQPQSALSLYGSGQTTGITVDLGYDTTIISPVYEGSNMSFARMQTGYAGAQVNHYFKELLDKRDIHMGLGHAEVIDDMMAKTMYLTKDAAMSCKDYEKPYKLPCGKTVDLYNEAFMASEMIFQPQLINADSKIIPLHVAIQIASLKCDLELRPELYTAIVTSGGLSMIPGLNERLQLELDALIGPGVKILTSTESDVVAWMGAATFAGIPEARRLWITRKQYEDHGAKIVTNRFM